MRYWWDSIDLEYCDDLLPLRKSLEKLKKNVLKGAEELSLKAIGVDIASTSSSSIGYDNNDEHSSQKIEALHENPKHLPLHLDGGGVTHQTITDVIKDDIKAHPSNPLLIFSFGYQNRGCSKRKLHKLSDPFAATKTWLVLPVLLWKSALWQKPIGGSS
uniref:Uncharacterized protein n=1 Tax=Nelumbo nucifera TaxID=4432 RepID=A0A822ZFG7_NELNU|nr:TPA_asm: hypothetical protein HUJ06_001490 [Nelumbo nucifera]